MQIIFHTLYGLGDKQKLEKVTDPLLAVKKKIKRNQKVVLIIGARGTNIYIKWENSWLHNKS
jgi:hypothetical protein